MTRNSIKHQLPTRKGSPYPGRWTLKNAKTRFSELVSRVLSEGPQHIAVEGCGDVVVIDVKHFRRLQGEYTGQALIDALAMSPHRELDPSVPPCDVSPVRPVKLY